MKRRQFLNAASKAAGVVVGAGVGIIDPRAVLADEPRVVEFRAPDGKYYALELADSGLVSPASAQYYNPWVAQQQAYYQRLAMMQMVARQNAIMQWQRQMQLFAAQQQYAWLNAQRQRAIVRMLQTQRFQGRLVSSEPEVYDYVKSIYGYSATPRYNQRTGRQELTDLVLHGLNSAGVPVKVTNSIRGAASVFQELWQLFSGDHNQREKVEKSVGPQADEMSPISFKAPSGGFLNGSAFKTKAGKLRVSSRRRTDRTTGKSGYVAMVDVAGQSTPEYLLV